MNLLSLYNSHYLAA
jgi:lysophospholipid acyltransferase